MAKPPRLGISLIDERVQWTILDLANKDELRKVMATYTKKRKGVVRRSTMGVSVTREFVDLGLLDGNLNLTAAGRQQFQRLDQYYGTPVPAPKKKSERLPELVGLNWNKS